MNIDQAENRRDRRLRKRLLLALHATRVRPTNGWASGRFLYDLVDGAAPGGQRFDSDLHMLGLIRDLVNAGYADERDDRQRAEETFAIDALSFRITAGGSALALEAIDPDPLVEDSRLKPAVSRQKPRRG